MGAPKTGDLVNFYFWSGGHEGAGKLHSCVARVTKVWDVDDHPQALGLMAQIPDEICKLEGYAKEQTHSRQRSVNSEDSVHVSGTWAQVVSS